ncbi:MAG: sprT domain-containing protein [Bacteroidetes bacterium]|nr:sprT domain-containing protein [Bacteroidota bacterium]
MAVHESELWNGDSKPVVRNDPADDDTAHPPLPPTLENSAELQFAYSYFNVELFGGELPDCIIVYTRKKHVLGHFCPDRFQRVGGELRTELSLNPTYLALCDDRESFSTLVHEQVHVWRHYLGPLNRKGGRGSSGHHDVIWADAMERRGLMPSNTGLPGGKRTGQQMTHYIIPGGAFDLACARLLNRGFRIHWRDHLVFADNPLGGLPSGHPVEPPEGSKKKDRIKFTCPNADCGLNAWARPTARITCGFCNLPMVPADAGKRPSSTHPPARR